jgi:alanyl aminopeptidase
VVADATDAAFEAGALTPAEFLTAAQAPAASGSWAVARAPLTRLDWLRDQLAGPEQRPALAAFVRRSYGPRLAALGSENRAGDDDEARIERQALIQLLARADDPALRRELAARGRAALADARLAPERLDPDQRATALWVLAQDGNEADFSALGSALAAETDAQLRLDLVRALASALEPQRAARVRALALATEIRAGELAALLGAQLGWEQNRAAGRAWFRENADAVLAKLPAQQAAYAPAIYASGACSEAEADEVETLFATRVAPLEGGPRAMAQLVESIRLCAALRAHHAKTGFGDALAETERVIR